MALLARSHTAHVGIPAISYALPAGARSVRELAAAGALESKPEMLERFGFQTVSVADDDETPYALGLSAAQALLRDHDIDPSSVDALIYGGAPGALAFVASRRAPDAVRALCDARRFHYPATRLQSDLGLVHATVIGIDQLACTSLFGAVRIARALCVTEGLRRVLCVCSEFYPSQAGREAITNCTSDAACVLLVERDATRNHVVGAASVTKGFFWDGSASAMRDEVIASYFPTAVHVIHEVLRDAGWSADDVTWVMPHNVSATSWEILFRLSRLPNARLWDDNIARIGHTLAGDNFINLRDATDRADVRAGDKVVLFSYGYGAHWTALAVEA